MELKELNSDSFELDLALLIDADYLILDLNHYERLKQSKLFGTLAGSKRFANLEIDNRIVVSIDKSKIFPNGISYASHEFQNMSRCQIALDRRRFK